MKKSLVRYKVFIILALLVVVFLPGFLVGDIESKTDAIITGVGIDKHGDGYEISLQYLIPALSGQSNKKLDVVNSSNGEISATIADLSLQIRKLNIDC